MKCRCCLKSREDDRRRVDCGRRQWCSVRDSYPQLSVSSSPRDRTSASRVRCLYSNQWVQRNRPNHVRVLGVFFSLNSRK